MQVEEPYGLITYGKNLESKIQMLQIYFIIQNIQESQKLPKRWFNRTNIAMLYSRDSKQSHYLKQQKSSNM